MQTFSIGELAQACNLNLETLRYYERIGLMHPPPRSKRGHRLYPASAAARLGFIRRSQDLGFTLTEIKELLELKRHEDELCVDVVHNIDSRIDEVEQKIASLRAMRRALGKMKDLCRGECLIGDCPILEHLEHAPSAQGSKRRQPVKGRKP